MADAVQAEHARKAIEEALKAHPRFASMKPYIERVALFRGSTLMVRYENDARTPGDPDNFAFEKVALKTYRALSGES